MLALNDFQHKILEFLRKKEKARVLDVAKALKEDQSKIMRAVLELKEKGLVEVWEQDEVNFVITPEGEVALNALPEEELVEYLRKHGPTHIKDLRIKEKEIAIAWAKNKNAILIEKGIVKLADPNQGIDVKEKELLKKIKEGSSLEEKDINHLKKRRFLEIQAKTHTYARITDKGKKIKYEVKDKVTSLTPEIIKNWQDYEFKRFDVVREKGEKIYSGKIHPVNQVIEYVRRIWLDMGFKEMHGNKVVQAFWNFDALFTPQDHPAREMQDTFYIDLFSKSIDAPAHIIENVKKMHERGDERSEGWGYRWSRELAAKYVMRTHTTVLSAMTLASLKDEDLPAKYFAIGKVFRNETLDWKHLFEFYQVEGFVASNEVNFRHLLGYLKLFFRKMGYEKIRVRPAYFPYTELSLEIEVFMPDKGWVELAGAGMFRPEVVKPLVGKEVKVLAWGLGLERIIMNYYGFRDIRDVYTTDVDLLRNLKRWYY